MQSPEVTGDFPNIKTLLVDTGRPTISNSNNNRFIYWAPFHH